MYFDLNVVVPIPAATHTIGGGEGKKGKGKAQAGAVPASFSLGQVAALEARIDLLVHCERLHVTDIHDLMHEEVGYSALALNQVAYKRVDAKTHSNVLDGLLVQLKKREGIAFLKRLTIVLDEDSEKGFGLVSASALNRRFSLKYR